MKTLKQFINERYINLFTPEDKEPYVDEVWNILQAAYAYTGGIHGNGFQSKERMINEIPFWKLNVVDGKVVAVRMYKSSDGRKAVASATNQSPEGKKAYKSITKEDLKRAYVEVSGQALVSFQNLLGDDFYKFTVPVDQVIKKLKNDHIEPLGDYFYKREIGGVMHKKIMLGNINSNPIKVPNNS